MDHALRDMDHVLRDMYHVSRDMNHALRDMDQVSRDVDHVSRDMDHNPHVTAKHVWRVTDFLDGSVKLNDGERRWWYTFPRNTNPLQVVPYEQLVQWFMGVCVLYMDYPSSCKFCSVLEQQQHMKWDEMKL